MRRLLIDPNKATMRLRIYIAISAVAMLTVVGGVRAVAEEHRQTTRFLKSKYRKLNREFFENSLPPARIEWANLTEYNYLGETYREDNGTFVVLIDRRTNLRDEDLQDTVFHEMCHIATWRHEDDPHGYAFRACMSGIKGKALQNCSIKTR
jgi:predicted SprT family Zn-dependent metalloprotease